jgi:bacteriocin-like protein
VEEDLTLERSAKMSDPKEETKAELSNEELASVQGGNRVDLVTLAPNYHGPKVGQTYGTGSIAQGEINSTGGNGDDGNMPDSGGGIIV